MYILEIYNIINITENLKPQNETRKQTWALKGSDRLILSLRKWTPDNELCLG